MHNIDHNSEKEPKTMRCAIYARFSTDSQSPKSIDDQVRECRSFMKAKGWTTSPEHLFCDYAISGAIADRDGYEALRQAASRYEFDYIIVDDLSRLGRDAGEAIRVFQELSILGVGIVGVADGIDSGSSAGKLPYYFKSIMNEVFLDDLKAKVRRGLKGKVLNGYSAGGRVYGYDYVPEYYENEETDKFGNRRKHGTKILVNKEQAEVVCRIFRLYASGIGYKAIATVLNQEGIPSPQAGTKSRAGFWRRSSMRGILTQEKYIGRWVWNKKKWNKKNPLGKTIVVDNHPDEWAVYEDEALRIVPQELWDQVQAKIRRLPKTKLGRGVRGKYPLSGILKCGKCGSSMVLVNSSSYSGYVCNGYWNGGKAVCDCGNKLPRQRCEEAILGDLVDLLEDRNMVPTITGWANEFFEAEAGKTTTTDTQLQERKTELQASIDSLLDLAEQGAASPTLRKRLAERESELAEVRSRLRALRSEAPAQQRLTEAEVRQEMSDVLSLVNDASARTGELKRFLSRIFPNKLMVTSREVGRKIEFTITGKAAPLLGTALPISFGSPRGNRTPV